MGRRQSDYSTPSIDEIILDTAIVRVKQSILTDQFTPWKFHPRGSSFEPQAYASKTFVTSISIQQNTSAHSWQSANHTNDIDESYTISLTEDGIVTITSISYLGALHALETLSQLFYKHSDPTAGIYTALAPVEISDYPSFQHRGLNLDITRNVFSPADVNHTIDAMASNKFNRLHLHATDAQSWPLEIPSFPELAAKGAYHPDQIWTVQDLQDVQSHGLSRGVSVFLEIDMPGHTASIAKAYPELITACDEQPDWLTYAAEPPSGQLKLNSSAVFRFVDTLLSDLLPRTTPYSSYFHSGGDEVNSNAYLFDETVLSNDSSTIQPLLQTFFSQVHNKIRAGGATPIIWEEMLLDWNLTLGPDVLVQTWRSDDALLQTVQKGFRALAGNYNHWYLDCGFGQWLDPALGSYVIAKPYADYCSPVKNWREIYTYDILSGIPPDLAHLVVGGEVHMWTEKTDPVNLDTMLWPRAAAAAEVLWSGSRDAGGNSRPVANATRRLAEQRERLVVRGVRAGPVQMVWCLQNEGGCAL